MRAFRALVFLLLLGGPALADVEGDKQLCADGQQPEETRIAACERLLQGDELTPDERVEAYWDQAEAYDDLDRYDEAIAALDAAIQLAPEEARLYRRRGSVKFSKRDYLGALADYDRVVELAPDEPWGHYARGLVLQRLERYDEALASFDRALDLRPGYQSALKARARLHHTLEHYELAIADYGALLAQDPYDPVFYVLRGQCFEALQQVAPALRDQRVAQLLNPNYRETQEAIERMLPAGFPPPEPLDNPYAAVGGEMAIDYLQIATTLPPAKDDMTAAIDELAYWFSGPPELPLPSMHTFLRRHLLPGGGDDVMLRTELLYPEIDGDLAATATGTGTYLFAIWPAELGGQGNTPPLSVLYNRNALAKVWQLAPGESLSGRAKLALNCPDPAAEPVPMAVALGCAEGVATVPIGLQTWVGVFEGWESILVPAGVFSTARFRTELHAEMHIFGGTLVREVTMTWWYAPALGWWVKRIQQEPGVEERQIMEAVVIERS